VLLTAFQWSYLKPLLEADRLKSSRGRPQMDPRLILECVLWKLALGLPWDSFPLSYPFLSEFVLPHPSFQTIYRRYRCWSSSGLLAEMLAALIRDLKERGGLDIFSGVLDGPIQFVSRDRVWVLEYDSSLQSTWQLTTALLLLSIFLKRKKLS